MEKTGETDVEAIIPNDPEIIQHPNLASGKNYGLIELFAMIPFLSKYLDARFPSDSHAKMNLDSPRSGMYFHYANQAAVKMTIKIYLHIMDLLEKNQVDSTKISGFTGK
jgi:hypothetical protein